MGISAIQSSISAGQIRRNLIPVRIDEPGSRTCRHTDMMHGNRIVFVPEKFPAISEA